VKGAGLIIGASVGSIGAQVWSDANVDRRLQEVMWYRPPIEDLNVLNPTGLEGWLLKAGLMDNPRADFEGFDYVVYAAGVNKLRWLNDMTFDHMREHFEVNVSGMVMLLSRIKTLWPEKVFSAVALTSDAARNPMRTSVAYCSSKAAQEMAIRVMAREWTGWRINGVAPAVVAHTNMSNSIDAQIGAVRGWTREEAAAYERTQLPLGRRVTKAEVSQVVRDVLTGPAYQTGSIVNISGGK